MKRGEPFDILITDIELGDGTCFDIFQEYPIKVPVIFTTAYDHFALDAFRNNGISYLLKPFGPQAIDEALAKAEKLVSAHLPDLSRLQDLLSGWKPKPRARTFLIRVGERVIPFSTDNIAALILEHGKVWLHTMDGQELLMDQTLEEFEHNVDATDFFRLNRQSIIHRKAIKDAKQRLDRKLEVNLKTDPKIQLVVSREKAPVFLEWLSVDVH
jgi:DNA-binding LytR/AlgR family response regulator